MLNTRYSDTKKWRLNNPEKIKAHRLVYVAKRNGSLIPEKCFCGKKKTEAHHWDYSKPLIITWYCKRHHAEADMVKRELGI